MATKKAKNRIDTSYRPQRHIWATTKTGRKAIPVTYTIWDALMAAGVPVRSGRKSQLRDKNATIGVKNSAHKRLLANTGGSAAVDVTPLPGYTWDDVMVSLADPDLQDYFKYHNIGFLDERDSSYFPWKATGPHFHIGVGAGTYKTPGSTGPGLKSWNQIYKVGNPYWSTVDWYNGPAMIGDSPLIIPQKTYEKSYNNPMEIVGTTENNPYELPEITVEDNAPSAWNTMLASNNTMSLDSPLLNTKSIDNDIDYHYLESNPYTPLVMSPSLPTTPLLADVQTPYTDAILGRVGNYAAHGGELKPIRKTIKRTKNPFYSIIKKGRELIRKISVEPIWDTWNNYTNYGVTTDINRNISAKIMRKIQEQVDDPVVVEAMKDTNPAQDAFLLDRKNQADVFKAYGYRLANPQGYFGLVDAAVKDKKSTPVWQVAKSDVNRADLIPISYGQSLGSENWYATKGAMPDPGSFPYALYLDQYGNLYQAGWDYNNYGRDANYKEINNNKDSYFKSYKYYDWLKKLGADVLDEVGNPTVLFTGYQLIDQPAKLGRNKEYNNFLIKNGIDPNNYTKNDLRNIASKYFAHGGPLGNYFKGPGAFTQMLDNYVASWEKAKNIPRSDAQIQADMDAAYNSVVDHRPAVNNVFTQMAQDLKKAQLQNQIKAEQRKAALGLGDKFGQGLFTPKRIEATRQRVNAEAKRKAIQEAAAQQPTSEIVRYKDPVTGTFKSLPTGQQGDPTNNILNWGLLGAIALPAASSNLIATSGIAPELWGSNVAYNSLAVPTTRQIVGNAGKELLKAGILGTTFDAATNLGSNGRYTGWGNAMAQNFGGDEFWWDFSNPGYVIAPERVFGNATLNALPTSTTDYLAKQAAQRKINTVHKMKTSPYVPGIVRYSYDRGSLFAPLEYGIAHSPIGKRAIEMAMRQTSVSDPTYITKSNLSKLLFNDKDIKLSNLSFKHPQLRGKLKYLFTGKDSGNPFNKTLNTDNEIYGGFFGRDMFNTNKSYPSYIPNDVIDAFLYKRPLNSTLGRPINTDYGIMTDYVSAKYPHKNIPIYELNTPTGHFPAEIKADDITKVMGVGNRIKLINQGEFDAAGHQAYEGLIGGNPYWGEQDIWKFNPEEYMQKWMSGGNNSNKIIEAALNIVNEAGTPIITRTPWIKGNLPKTRFDVEAFNIYTK